MPTEKSASHSYSSSLLRAGNEVNEAHTRLPFFSQQLTKYKQSILDSQLQGLRNTHGYLTVSYVPRLLWVKCL